jgi:hypothetical protein
MLKTRLSWPAGIFYASAKTPAVTGFVPTRKISRREVYDWLGRLRVTHWELYPQVIPGNSVRRQHVAQGRGVGLVSPIYRQCLRYPNLTWLWNTRVTGLLIESESEAAFA